MLNPNIKSISMLPRLTVNPLKAFFNFDKKMRQRQKLRTLDARTLQDIGMSEARRHEELQNWHNW